MRNKKRRPWRRAKKSTSVSSPKKAQQGSLKPETTTTSSAPILDLNRHLKVRAYIHSKQNTKQKIINISRYVFSEDEHDLLKQSKTIAVRLDIPKGHDRKESFLVRNYEDIEWVERGSRLRGLPLDAKLSVRSDIASRYGIISDTPIVLRLAEIKSMGLDFAEVSLDRATSADVWGVHRSLRGKCLHDREDVKRQLHIRVNSLLRNRSYVFAGVFRPTTKLITRSLACDLTWLIQLSTEMFEFGDDGDFYWEKMIDQFIRDLLRKWSDLKVRHSLTVVLFARIKTTSSTKSQHRDFYDIALREVSVDAWEALLPKIRT